MNESLKYRTIQKALFQTYFMDEYDFYFLHYLCTESVSSLKEDKQVLLLKNQTLNMKREHSGRTQSA